MTVCRYCGQPIKKFVFGWIHDNAIAFLIPQHLHVAKPRVPERRRQ